ncbi:hypothetical protein Ddye_027441 [Dipteronia dyeriana]|uniref:Myb/SANT-like domain-containing protein n=1 Tax=Dipteronia dyeriana TaxID=168575 RepID=A0AAD9WQH7_9ROSI|nr:hypothetical protein Ddye_027441 [Dipteronia dyeriana]
MGKKKTTNISGKPKALWPDDLVAIFSEICVKEAAKGHRSGAHFDKMEWVNVVKVFKETTGVDYDEKQLKNKWDKMKTNWKLWSSQLHKETGIGWDPAKKMMDAPPNWWQRKIKNYNHVEYRQKGKFGGSEHDKRTVDSENEETSQDDQDRGKKRTNDESEINKGVVGGSKGKKRKLRSATKLYKQIDRLVEVVENSSTTTSSVRRSSQGTSIAEVMEVVATLPGAEKGSQLWWFATELFCSQDKREMFSVMTDPDLKLQFLILNYKKTGN